MSREVRSLARREAVKLVKERTLVLAVVTQFTVAGFAAFLLVGLAQVLAPDAPPPVPVGVALAGDDAPMQALRSNGLTVRRVDTVETGMALLADRSVDALIVADPPVGDGPAKIAILSPSDDVRAALALSRVRTALVAYEDALRQERADRLATDPLPRPPRAPAANTDLILYSVLVPLLALLPAFLAGAAAADTLTEERETGTVALLRSTPAHPTRLMLGKLVVHWLTAPLLAGAWLLLLAANGFGVGDPWLVVLSVAGVGAVLVGIGASLSLFARSRGHVQLLYTAAATCAVVLLSLMPRSPANVVARAAAGTAGAMDWWLVGAVLVIGAAAALFVLQPRVARTWVETPV